MTSNRQSQHQQKTSMGCSDTVDWEPWNHPFLTTQNIKRFRAYSADVWEIAKNHSRNAKRRLNVAFAVNIAQNMYKWARMADDRGFDVSLYLHPQEVTAINTPQWEEFDGEFLEILDGESFLSRHSGIRPLIPCRKIPMDGMGLLAASQQFQVGNRKPLLRLMAECPGIRHEAALAWDGVYPYLAWARELSNYDVVFAASSPIAAYLSGRPYCAQSVGADLQFDCGRSDSYGQIHSLSFNGARFITLGNPHPLSHCRRLGLTKAVYLPYPMDDRRYRPGRGAERRQWEADYGQGVYILSTARIDNMVKGNGETIFDALSEAARSRPNLRFVFLNWGNHAEAFRQRINRTGFERQFIFLPPVGKKRLIDYYRSCDVVLDQFVFGYYGATALDAAAVGKPIIMHLRQHHYAALYNGDVPPVESVSSMEALYEAIIRLTDNSTYRLKRGKLLRKWLVRNHGSHRTVPIMMSLLRLAADHVALPIDLVNPLMDDESEEEAAYHAACITNSLKAAS